MAGVTVHLVGGFLGSGKTTAIRSACELLRQRGEAASVITNDQGTLLVDTAFLQGSCGATIRMRTGDNQDENLIATFGSVTQDGSACKRSWLVAVIGWQRAAL